MIDERLRAAISELGASDSVVFDSPSFDGAIIGISYDDRVIYDYEEMVFELMKDEGLSYEDAAEFIGYNTLSFSPPVDYPPIIMMYDRDAILEY